MAERAGPDRRPARSMSLGYGVTTGQVSPPPEVHAMRPWMAGLIGVLAAM